MVEREQSRRLRLGRQLFVEPAQLLGREVAGVLTGDDRVEGDEPQVADRRRVVDRLVPLPGQVEGRTQPRPVVVIARDDVQRDLEPREHLASAPVSVLGAIVGQVAGDEHRVRPVRQRPHRLDHRFQARDRIHPVLVAADVEIAELDEESGRCKMTATIPKSHWTPSPTTASEGTPRSGGVPSLAVASCR